MPPISTGFLSLQYRLGEAPASHVRRRTSGYNQGEPWRAEEIPQLLPAHHVQCPTSISTEEFAVSSLKGELIADLLVSRDEVEEKSWGDCALPKSWSQEKKLLSIGCGSSGLGRKAGQTPGPVYWAPCCPPGRIGVVVVGPRQVT